MADAQGTPEKSQSGVRLALGIFGFMIGIILILWLVKHILGI